MNANQAANQARNEGNPVWVRVLEEVCHLTHGQTGTLILDGYDGPASVINWRYDAIRKWAQEKSKITQGRGGCTYGDRKIKAIQGLVWWVNEQTIRGLDANLMHFNEAMLNDSIEMAQMDDERKESRSANDKPDAFKAGEWIKWESKLVDYFHSVYNTKNIPLSYVIRKAATKEHHEMSRDEQIIHSAALEGPLFEVDTKDVLRVIKELTTGTPAEAWVKNTTCGRTAMQQLRDHYDGMAEGEKRKLSAKDNLDNLHYRNEQTFSFEKYITALQDNFQTLARYNIEPYEEDKVRTLLNGIRVSNQEFITCVSIARSRYDTFIEAATYLSGEASRIFGNKVPRGSRKVYDSHRGGRGFQRGGRGYHSRGRGRGRSGRGGRGGRGQHGKKFNNGVDISDPTRFFSDEEWDKLDNDTRREIVQNPERRNAIESRKRKAAAANLGSRYISDGDTAAIINGVMNASRQNQSTIAAADIRGPQLNGSNAGGNRATGRPSRETSDTRSVASSVTYNHKGDVVE